MTDRDLATALAQATTVEGQARARWEAACRIVTPLPDTIPERDAALVVARHATALRRSLEQWLAARASRAALKT